MTEQPKRRRLSVVPPHPDTTDERPQPTLLRMDAADKAEHVRAAYAAGELSREEAAGMLAALAGREGNDVEYGWRADMIFEGLLTCGACGAHLQQDQAAGVISYTCTAGGCGRVRIAARVLAPAVAEQVLERLRTPELAPGLLLSIA